MNKQDEYHGSSFVTKPEFDPEIIAKQDEKYPKISIVMPSYNQGQFIKRSNLSVINQNYPNTELIIIDGGSDDDTVDILKKYDEYIAFWVSETDRAQSHAINKGIDRSTGELITWLNADDLFLPNALKGIGKE
jgi:glycosyltransferase involved in cell wall biosynthesis